MGLVIIRKGEMRDVGWIWDAAGENTPPSYIAAGELAQQIKAASSKRRRKAWG